MIRRTDEEIKAYIDGYNDCFDKFTECLRGRKSVMDAVRKMQSFREVVNNVCHMREGAEQE